MLGIDVTGLPVSSDEILWVECRKCEQSYHQLCVEVESEELSEEVDGIAVDVRSSKILVSFKS